MIFLRNSFMFLFGFTSYMAINAIEEKQLARRSRSQLPRQQTFAASQQFQGYPYPPAVQFHGQPMPYSNAMSFQLPSGSNLFFNPRTGNCYTFDPFTHSYTPMILDARMRAAPYNQSLQSPYSPQSQPAPQFSPSPSISTSPAQQLSHQITLPHTSLVPSSSIQASQGISQPASIIRIDNTDFDSSFSWDSTRFQSNTGQPSLDTLGNFYFFKTQLPDGTIIKRHIANIFFGTNPDSVTIFKVQNKQEEAITPQELAHVRSQLSALMSIPIHNKQARLEFAQKLCTSSIITSTPVAKPADPEPVPATVCTDPELPAETTTQNSSEKSPDRVHLPVRQPSPLLPQDQPPVAPEKPEEIKKEDPVPTSTTTQAPTKPKPPILSYAKAAQPAAPAIKQAPAKPQPQVTEEKKSTNTSIVLQSPAAPAIQEPFFPAPHPIAPAHDTTDESDKDDNTSSESDSENTLSSSLTATQNKPITTDQNATAVAILTKTKETPQKKDPQKPKNKEKKQKDAAEIQELQRLAKEDLKKRNKTINTISQFGSKKKLAELNVDKWTKELKENTDQYLLPFDNDDEKELEKGIQYRSKLATLFHAINTAKKDALDSSTVIRISQYLLPMALEKIRPEFKCNKTGNEIVSTNTPATSASCDPIALAAAIALLERRDKPATATLVSLNEDSNTHVKAYKLKDPDQLRTFLKEKGKKECIHPFSEKTAQDIIDTYMKHLFLEEDVNLCVAFLSTARFTTEHIPVLDKISSTFNNDDPVQLKIRDIKTQLSIQSIFKRFTENPSPELYKEFYDASHKLIGLPPFTNTNDSRLLLLSFHRINPFDTALSKDAIDNLSIQERKKTKQMLLCASEYLESRPTPTINEVIELYFLKILLHRHSQPFDDNKQDELIRKIESMTQPNAHKESDLTQRIDALRMWRNISHILTGSSNPFSEDRVAQALKVVVTQDLQTSSAESKERAYSNQLLQLLNLSDTAALNDETKKSSAKRALLDILENPHMKWHEKNINTICLFKTLCRKGAFTATQRQEIYRDTLEKYCTEQPDLVAPEVKDVDFATTPISHFFAIHTRSTDSSNSGKEFISNPKRYQESNELLKNTEKSDNGSTPPILMSHYLRNILLYIESTTTIPEAQRDSAIKKIRRLYTQLPPGVQAYMQMLDPLLCEKFGLES